MIVAPRHYYITVRVKTLREFQAGFFAFGNCNMFLIEMIQELTSPCSFFLSNLISLPMKFRQLEGRFVQFFTFLQSKICIESAFEI